MTAVALVRVILDDNVPEHMMGIIRCGSVFSEDENGETIKDHQDLVDNTEFRSESELIAFVAQQLGISESIVEVES